METCLSRNIPRDLLMAFEAKAPLLLFREGLVAVFTFLFKLAVRLNDVARRDQLFEKALRVGSLQCGQEQNESRQGQTKPKRHVRSPRSI